jgi:hypothetical protein
VSGIKDSNISRENGKKHGFQKGNPGRPKGSRNRAAILAEKILSQDQYCPVNLKGVGQKANSGAVLRVTNRVSDLNGK